MSNGNGDFCVHVLASGSKGNATVVSYKDTMILIDAGISAKRITDGLKAMGKTPYDLDAILLTHEHSDHISGLPQLLKNYNIPVFCKAATWSSMMEKVAPFKQLMTPLTRRILDIGSLNIETFAISHDAVDPVGFSCYGGDQKLTFVTDTGIVDDEILAHMDESTMLVLEANHDVEMLRFGPYSPVLKQRVAGPKGHLNNVDTARAILMMKRPPQLQIVFAHRSEQNNTEQRVEGTVYDMLQREGLRLGVDLLCQHGKQKECVIMRERI